MEKTPAVHRGRLGQAGWPHNRVVWVAIIMMNPPNRNQLSNEEKKTLLVHRLLLDLDLYLLRLDDIVVIVLLVIGGGGELLGPPGRFLRALLELGGLGRLGLPLLGGLELHTQLLHGGANGFLLLLLGRFFNGRGRRLGNPGSRGPQGAVLPDMAVALALEHVKYIDRLQVYRRRY